MESHSILGALRCPIDPAISGSGPFNLMVRGGRNQDKQGGKKRFNGMVIFTLWNLCKERNRRIFNNAHESVMQVASRVKEDIEQRKRALT
jgi:hypothetical protein